MGAHYAPSRATLQAQIDALAARIAALEAQRTKPVTPDAALLAILLPELAKRGDHLWTIRELIEWVHENGPDDLIALIDATTSKKLGRIFKRASARPGSSIVRVGDDPRDGAIWATNAKPANVVALSHRRGGN